MKTNTSKFKENDTVQVLPGTKDPDFKINIGGWVGEIEEIELFENTSWLYKIRWSKETIMNAGEGYIDRCENENLDYEVMFLAEKEIKLFQIIEDTNTGFLIA